MQVVYFQDVSVATEGIANESELFFVFSDFFAKFLFFSLHVADQSFQKVSSIVNPSGLKLDLQRVWPFLVVSILSEDVTLNPLLIT